MRIQGIANLRAPRNEETLPSLQDVYALVMSRASSMMRTAAIIAAVVFSLWGIGFVVFAIVGVLLIKRYVRQHRITGTLVKYQDHGDWVVVEIEGGTRVTAHCPLAGLDPGTEVRLSVRRDGIFVIDPTIASEEAVLVALEASEAEAS
jgi:hypothetical protein